MYVPIHTIIVRDIFNTGKRKPKSRANELAERKLRIAKQMHVTDDRITWLWQSKYLLCFDFQFRCRFNETVLTFIIYFRLYDVSV